MTFPRFCGHRIKQLGVLLVRGDISEGRMEPLTTLACRLPPRLRRWRLVFPLEAGIGQAPQSCGNKFSGGIPKGDKHRRLADGQVVAQGKCPSSPRSRDARRPRASLLSCQCSPNLKASIKIARLGLSSAQLLSVSEKSHEKIQSQYERHERQHKQRPITIAAHFWRGLATHEEEAKDTIAPRVHGSSIGEAHGILENARVLFFRRRW